MRTYMSPIGYNTTSVTRVLLSRGFETGDTVVLLRPATETDDSRAREAIGDVERMFTEIEPEISIAVERVQHDDFSAAVLTCSDVLRAAEGRVIVNLSGGARDVFLPFTVAVLAHAPRIDTALAFSDIDGHVRERELPVLTADISDSSRLTLELIEQADGGISVPQLADRTTQAKSTITRHVNQLAESGAITTWQEGKTKHARMTLTGRLILAAPQA